MYKILSRRPVTDDIVSSSLYNQDTFFGTFHRDIKQCQKELIIESPFITERRMQVLLPILQKLRRRGVSILVNTRNPEEHDEVYEVQAMEAVAQMQALGITVLYTAGHHRKLAIIDRKVIWEGSLNILSFNDSCEIMRKITSTTLAKQLVEFTAVDIYLRGA